MIEDQASAENLPSDNHLQDDISAPTGNAEKTPGHFTPGQTNAGQQAAGQASATAYGEDQDPENSATDSNNNPV
jgi:hypothetical protein